MKNNLTFRLTGRIEPASFVAIEIETGIPVAEFFQKSVAEKVNKKKYRVLPIADYLVSLNGGEGKKP